MPTHKTYFTPTTTATTPDDNVSTVLSSPPAATSTPSALPATDDSDEDDEASSNGYQDFASLGKYMHAHRHKHTQTQVVASLHAIAALTGNSIATIKEDGDLILDDENIDIPVEKKRQPPKQSQLTAKVSK